MYMSLFRNVCILVILCSCTKTCSVSRDKMSADEVLLAYLDIAFNMEEISQKNNLMSFTTGPLKVAIASANDETIKKAYLNERYKIERFDVLQREDQTPIETHLTYQLDYLDLKDSLSEKNAVRISTQNTVSVIREDGVWYIQDVLGSDTEFVFLGHHKPEIMAK